MNNVTLIGIPGAGKSTLGVVLAKILGYEFLDSDLLIQMKRYMNRANRIPMKVLGWLSPVEKRAAIERD